MEKVGGREQGGHGGGPGSQGFVPRLVIVLCQRAVRITKSPCTHRGWHSKAVQPGMSHPASQSPSSPTIKLDEAKGEGVHCPPRVLGSEGA